MRSKESLGNEQEQNSKERSEARIMVKKGGPRLKQLKNVKRTRPKYQRSLEANKNEDQLKREMSHIVETLLIKMINEGIQIEEKQHKSKTRSDEKRRKK